MVAENTKSTFVFLFFKYFTRSWCFMWNIKNVFTLKVQIKTYKITKSNDEIDGKTEKMSRSDGFAGFLLWSRLGYSVCNVYKNKGFKTKKLWKQTLCDVTSERLHLYIHRVAFSAFVTECCNTFHLNYNHKNVILFRQQDEASYFVICSSMTHDVKFFSVFDKNVQQKTCQIAVPQCSFCTS